MKRFAFAVAALAAFVAVPALGADMATPVYKVPAPPPPPVPVYTWTGCWIGAGGGYSIWDQRVSVPGVTATDVTYGGKGWFGTAGGGCDVQLNSDWVIGAFADWDFGNVEGTPSLGSSGTTLFGTEKEDWAWAVGGRFGYAVMPGLLGFFEAGYTQKHFKSFELFDLTTGVDSGLFVNKATYPGWFMGSGYEVAIRQFPGLFWKSEYRYAETGHRSLCAQDATTVFSPCGDARKYQQSVRSELVWRFNWGAPIQAAY